MEWLREVVMRVTEMLNFFVDQDRQIVGSDMLKDGEEKDGTQVRRG